MHMPLRMRICLYWNAGAGDERPLDDITSAIVRAGHEVARVIHQGDDVSQALHLSIDAVVAAGGDGTVARAGRVLAGTSLPLAILPLGTANNIAATLGIEGEMTKVIADWTSARPVQIDVGVIKDDEGERLFVEGVGTGLMPKAINRGRNVTKPHFEDSAAEVDWARQMFLDALAALQPQHSAMCIEGDDVVGEYLLVEVLNITSVGPRLRLSAETTPADGFLSVVVAREEDRAAIASHLRLPWDDADNHAWLKSWRTHTVEVSGWTEYHVDDEVRTSRTGKLSIAMRPHALTVLA
jgi:diacylglycerol kinase (ATP)